MEKYDTSQLTEFPRFESESNQSGVTTFFNKLWKLPLFSPNETTEETEKSSGERKQSDGQPDNARKQSFDDTKTESGSYAVEFEGRSLPNVLQRISSLIALGSGGGTRYADTELARYWMPDDISRECYECAARFGALRRRHHCRVCGQIFCSRCCSQRVPGQIFGCAGGLRVCTYCCNVVLSYLRENDAAGDISPDLRTLQENLQVKFPDNKAADKGGDNFMFARQQEERPEPRADTTESLHDLIRQLAFSLPMQQHRFRLVRYNSVWRGCDVMQWLMDNTTNKTRAQAGAVCQALLSAGHLESVTEPPHFADYALYRPAHHDTQHDTQPDDNNDSGEECGRLVESVSSYCLDLNLGDSSARITKATKTTESKSSPPSEEHPILDQNEGGEAAVLCRLVEQSGTEHLALLLRQCLARAALAPSWLHVLYPLCQQAADIILPDMYGNDIDVRNYVQVKKVPGGAPHDSCLLQGVVLTKNVAHRGMPQEISNPTVLLLDCSIAYQRVEGKLTSLEPLLMQEQEYLVRCAARITALRPKVVLVRGGAARGVQDALRAAGVALASNVRERALRRAARCAHADLVASVDARIATPRLGTANHFYVKNFSGKTLMVLEGCAEPHLGCCILLRGASLAELVRVKKVVKFMLLAFYNWKFEKAFLADIEAVLPEPGMSFGDEEAECASETDVQGENERQEKESLFNEPKEEDKSMDVNKSGKTDNIIDDMEDSNIELFTRNKTDTKSITSELNDKEVKNIKENEESLKEQDDNEEVMKPSGRKTDGDKNLSCGVPIRDFSDPLRATLSMDDEVFLPNEEAELKADSHSERWCTDDAVLSMSPNIVIPAPRLPLRVPPPHTPHTPRPKRRPQTRPQHTHLLLKEPHPFIKMAISSPAEDPRLRAALANYRATGARVANGTHKPECPQYKPSVVKPPESEGEGEEDGEGGAKGGAGAVPDPLAPEQHQRLSLLLYSCSDKSANVPDFCVNPWIVTMEMYGRHDISLGAFLERHCFDGDHRCPSANCQVPMNRHLRRFVHGDACITITCNTIGHSNVDNNKHHSTEVRVWTRCERCGARCGGRRLSRLALSLSLAQYMRLRLSATRYVRRRLCPHPLHAHAHAFVARLTTACFRYNKISMYDIQLPPDVISINYDTKRMRDNLIAHLNELMLKGHETFSSVSAGEVEEKEREYSAFRHHMDNIHLALTSASLHEHVTLASVVRNLWNVSDNMITGERMLRDAQDKWSSPISKNKLQTELNQEDKEVDDTSVETAANDSSDSISKEIDKEHNIGTEEDEEKGDKKTVKQILSQLLSSNQQANQNGIILSSGVVPVLVRAGDVGSVIAATLASLTYQKTLRAQRYSTQSEQEDGESTAAGKEKNDGDKTKSSAAKSHEHIEVLLKDGLACRVYFALQFHVLRHAVLAAPGAPAPPTTCSCHAKEKDGKNVCDVEEGFIRSLAQCVPWAARGGKSGSTFCKTEDDRYVLKEMTKPEWQQFLEFAPHYFSYVNSCRLNNQPSLLARILGVFSVGGSGSGVLVMENVWYGAAGLRFDLKGTARPRLPPAAAPPTAPPTHAPHTPHASLAAPTVLVDLNLLHLRWERQLYVPGHQCCALWTALGRDTAFLAASGVMDYSLLLGIHNHTLVLGVIDYIRTFTWDKKLEHLVKKNLGSGQPTVVSPEEYRRRFCAACRKYFLQCPAHWDHLYDNMDAA
ncbi:PREDICTED: putative 1-phosphatidylinositol 3-phosphate 5-kinase isoform X1 [Papilio xuthus]|uniref:1-phosphatidylinositol-3-phosphate 5-kinase n=1 Tax=Papilio xuthus TaxID=66420 RepID=A0AAJ7ED15_PAPXU|nr:PREDICTED: putative 1-phosphatidylinositol 3-phosphate 5-kinase isoform X1 [Papilio xuthus]